MRRHRRILNGLGCAQDWGVAGAATEVACKLILVIGCAVAVRRGHRHHKTGGAKATLAAVVIDQRLLHRVQGAIGGGKPFDGGDRCALQLRQKQDAGVEGAGALVIMYHDGAGTAVAFVAALFGAGQGAAFAQILQQCCGGRWICQLDFFTVQMKGERHNRLPVALPCLPWLWRHAGLRCDVKGGRAFLCAGISLGTGPALRQ